MNILVVGSGGREHALGWKVAKSPLADKIYFAPGNGGTEQVGTNLDIDMLDFEAIKAAVSQHNIELVIVGPEIPLVAGLVDFLQENNILAFGPQKSAAIFEDSKSFTADFLEKHNIPRPQSYTAHSLEQALEYIDGKDPKSYVIKATGLAAGKGVVLPETTKEAQDTLSYMMSGEAFGDAGKIVVFQERLQGQEVSAFAISDGTNILMLPFFQDHKQVFDADKGPNTGGMGAYTPVPFVDDSLAKKIQTEVMQATIDGMKADGREYRGVLYAGLFVTNEGEIKVIEFNVRFGDPECQPMMLAAESDLLPIFIESAKGELQTQEVTITKSAVATVCLTSGGYPGKYPTGIKINGLEKNYPEVMVFHAGTTKKDDQILTAGGRVLNITAVGTDMKSALSSVYAAIGEDAINFENMHFRTDIGHRVA